VSVWKGITKPLAAFALGAVALGGFLHYITVGPKDEPVDDDDMDPTEEDAEKHTDIRPDRTEQRLARDETRRDL